MARGIQLFRSGRPMPCEADARVWPALLAPTLRARRNDVPNVIVEQIASLASLLLQAASRGDGAFFTVLCAVYAHFLS